MTDKLRNKSNAIQYPAIRNLRWGFRLLGVLLLTILLGYSWSSWKSVKQDKFRELSTIAELSSNSLGSYLFHYESALKVLAEDLFGQSGKLDPERSHKRLKLFLQAYPDLQIVNINRPDGLLLVSSSVLPGNNLPHQGATASFIKGREALLQGENFNIGRSVYAPLAKGWIIPLRYAVRDSKGALLYILVAVLPLSQQQTFWHNLSLPENTALGLLRDDAYLLSRYPDNVKADLDVVYGKPRTGILVEHLQQSSFPVRGNIEGWNSVAQQNYLFGYRRLTLYPVTLFVATSVDNVRIAWWLQVRSMFVLMLLLMLGSFFVYRWTFRKQLKWEQERELTSEKLRSIFEGSNDAIILLSKNGFIECNVRALNMFGMAEKSEFLNSSPADISARIQPDGRDSEIASREHVALALEQGRNHYEWLCQKKNGQAFPVEIELTAFNYAGDRILQATVHDLTENKNIKLALQRETSSWVQAMDSFVDAIYLLDAERRLVRANRMFYSLLQIEPEQVIGKHIAAIMHPLGDAEMCPVCGAQADRMDAVITMEADHPYNPARRPVEVSVKVMHDESGVYTGTLMSIHDLTHTRSIEDSLRESEARLRRISAEAPFPMMVHAEDGEIIEINKVWCETTGYSHEDIPTIGSWVNKAYGLKLEDVLHHKEKIYGASHRLDQGEFEIRCKDGSMKTWLISSSPVGKLPDGRRFVVSMAQDISESKAAQEQIEFLAFHDALTGLPNRLLAKDHLEQAILSAQRDRNTVALMFVDLDKFKTINDSLGHVVGDSLLKAVALRLRESLRDTDTLSRQGGDEFLIILNEVRDTDGITLVAEKVLARLAEPFYIDPHELSISLSIGIAVFPDDGKDFETLLKKSDTAMYQAKESGRNTYRFHTEQMNTDAVEHLRMRNGLRRALELGEFVLHYQPQISLKTGMLIGAEALIRWRHPELGMVPPGRFIAIAEDSGLIVPMGDWVLQEACRQAVAWRTGGLPELIMAVNLSAVQFKRGDVEQSVVKALQASGLSASLLELELTESILIKDTEKVLATVHRLKAMGVKFSIDDFGTGYSSLSYLKRFNVDKLKIDQSFVRDMADDPNDAAIVSAIIQMAKSLKLTIIAEGVEDEHQLALLKQQHCDEVQGYYFAKPMPADEFMQFALRSLQAG